MSSPLHRNIIVLTSMLQIAFACLAMNNGDSEPPITKPQNVCSRCPTLYAPNCNGLTGRRLCLTSTQAQVHRTEVAGKCIFNYTCPKPTHANAWVGGHGPGPLVITGELQCNAPNYVWKNADYGPISKLSCMSEARTNVCSRCPTLYAPNCNGLTGRHLCLTSTQAQVHRTEVAGKCIFNYTCPEPTSANAWVPGYGPGPLVITSELHCNAPNYVWRNADYGPIWKFACMSRARTRCGGCVDIYKPKDPCLVNDCAPRKYVSLWVIKDPKNKNQCLMNFLCPVGTEAYVFDTNAKMYIRATGRPLTCVDHGTGSPWYQLLSSPTRNIRVDHVSCFSEI